MKPLKEYITEGILDIENNINYDIKEDVIKDFLEENYDIRWCSYTIKNIKRKFIVDVKGNIMVKNKDITSLTNEFFEFGSVSENFNCHDCKSLRTLKGAPKEVGRGFNCNWCSSLTDLNGAPKKVGGNFECDYCNNLTNLEGAPQKVECKFFCNYCDNLISLEGAPKKVGSRFDCSHCKSLTSLIGGPKEVGGDFYCVYCESLRSLEGAPKKVAGEFCCNDCGIKFKTTDIKKYTKVAGYIRA
jgi:hypothetical protein